MNIIFYFFRFKIKNNSIAQLAATALSREGATVRLQLTEVKSFIAQLFDSWHTYEFDQIFL